MALIGIHFSRKDTKNFAKETNTRNSNLKIPIFYFNQPVSSLASWLLKL